MIKIKHSYIIFILFILLFSSAVSAFYIGDTFDSFQQSQYINVSRLGTCDVSVSSGTLRFNGTSCGAGNTGTYVQPINYIDSQSDGFLSFNFKGVTNGNDNDHYDFGLRTIVSTGIYGGAHISKDLDQVYVSNFSVRLCSGDQKTPDNNWHTITINVTRGRNSTGYAKNTTFSVTYDGSSWCTKIDPNALNVYANFTDISAGGAGHDYLVDNLIFTDGNYTNACNNGCTSPCIWQDNFNNYISDISTCGWLKMPNVNISPENMELCFNSSSGSQRIDAPLYSYGQNPNIFTNTILTEEFYITIFPNAALEKTFYLNNINPPTTYKIDFYDYSGSIYMQYFSLNENNTPILANICSNCFPESTKTKIKVWCFLFI